MTFAARLAARSAVDYADFLLPHVAADARVLDVGCGEGTVSVGLAAVVGQVVGIDLRPEEFADVREHARRHGHENVGFAASCVYALGFSDGTFDACLCHSVIETLERPVEALGEIRRVLRPGGILGAASVEYGGLILAGPDEPLLRRFYAIRERAWQLERVADPYQGRELRGLLHRAGFERVVATTRYFSYGTAEAVRAFGAARADDCRDEWYIGAAHRHGLATPADLEAMRQAWLVWSESPDAYAAFAWCRALGWKPDPAGTVW